MKPNYNPISALKFQLALIILAVNCIISPVFAQNETDSLQKQVLQLERQIEFLKYSELIQSMSQRSLLTPNYFAELKALVAKQAFNFWAETSHEALVSHKNVYSALHNANKNLGYDSARFLAYNQIGGHQSKVVSIEFGENPNVFYSAGTDGRILKWNMHALHEPPTVVYENNVIFRSIDVSFDDRWILAPTYEHGVFLISVDHKADKLNSEVDINMISRDPEQVQSAMFMPGELKYVMVNKRGHVKMKGYGLDSIRTTTDEPVRTLLINKANNDLYAGTDRGTIHIWEVDIKDWYLNIPELYAVNSLAINSDQSMMAIGREKGDAVLWDIRKKEVIRIISGHSSAITDIDFSSDNKMLVTASRDGTARIWEIDKPKKLPIVLDDHNDWVMTACFDKSGSKILTGSKDNLIRIWPLDPALLADRICGFVSRNLSQDEWKEYIGQDIGYADTCPIDQ